MKKKMFVALASVFMLSFTPTASAYWTGHAEIIMQMIQDWITSHTEEDEGNRGVATDDEQNRSEDPRFRHSASERHLPDNFTPLR